MDRGGSPELRRVTRSRRASQRVSRRATQLLWFRSAFRALVRLYPASFRNHPVIARLRDGVTVDQASAEMAALAARVYENYPARSRSSGYSLTVTAVPLADEVAGEVRRPLLVLLGAVGLVLLVVCANVA
jgi:hypothetical protein